MKCILFFAGALSLFAACNFGKEIQVERVNMQLVRIDTIYRETGDFKVFTWESENRLKYQSLEPITSPGPDLGTTIAMLIKR